MKTDLLLKLADMLEADAANPNGMKFDLGMWADSYLDDKPISCETTGCAMGLAALSGEFPGLTFEISGPMFVEPNDSIPYFGFDAATKLFEISSQEANKLFAYVFYKDTIGATAELDVAARIRQLVAVGNIDDVVTYRRY